MFTEPEEQPPISHSVVRALVALELLAEELADCAILASAEDRAAYECLAPKLERLERFGERVDEEQLAELRALLMDAQRLRDDMRRR